MKYIDFKDIFGFVKGIFINQVEKFEKHFANYIGTKHAIATSFGRTALFAGLKAINVTGGEVILPSFICTVVRHAIVLAGAKPVFVDIDYNTFEYDINQLKQKINKKTKAIVLVHYFGGVAQKIQELAELTKGKNIYLIEDCAHSLGAELHGQKIGTYGDFAIFSLTKNMINFGGGVLTTKDENIANSTRQILSQYNISIKKRISNFPFILLYGYDQFVAKVILERIKIHRFEKLLLNLSNKSRNTLNTLFKVLSFFKQPALSKMNTSSIKNKVSKIEKPEFYKLGLHMESIIATVGLRQLKKLDQLNNQRQYIFSRVLIVKNRHNTVFSHNSVCTNFILNFEKSDIFKMIELLKKQGVYVKTSWPTHQIIWNDQDSTVLRKLEKDILIWNINPNLSEKEINKFLNAIDSVYGYRKNKNCTIKS